MMPKRKVALYICMSLDGFIATNDDDLSWTSVAEKEGEDYGYHDFVAEIDTYIIGRKTYDWVINELGKFPQAEQFDCYILTRQERPNENGVTFYNGAIEELIAKIRAQEGKNIYCDGGAEIVKLLMDKDLIDEYIISVIPVLLGDGKRLFKGETPQMDLIAQPAKYYDTGVVQLHYLRRR